MAPEPAALPFLQRGPSLAPMASTGLPWPLNPRLGPCLQHPQRLGCAPLCDCSQMSSLSPNESVEWSIKCMFDYEFTETEFEKIQWIANPGAFSLFDGLCLCHRKLL